MKIRRRLERLEAGAGRGDVIREMTDAELVARFGELSRVMLEDWRGGRMPLPQARAMLRPAIRAVPGFGDALSAQERHDLGV